MAKNNLFGAAIIIVIFCAIFGAIYVNSNQSAGSFVFEPDYNLYERLKTVPYEELLPEEQAYSKISCNCTKAVQEAKKQCKRNNEECYEKIGHRYCTECKAID